VDEKSDLFSFLCFFTPKGIAYRMKNKGKMKSPPPAGNLFPETLEDMPAQEQHQLRQEEIRN
jgi:hypothetical protein